MSGVLKFCQIPCLHRQPWENVEKVPLVALPICSLIPRADRVFAILSSLLLQHLVLRPGDRAESGSGGENGDVGGGAMPLSGKRVTRSKWVRPSIARPPGSPCSPSPQMATPPGFGPPSTPICPLMPSRSGIGARGDMCLFTFLTGETALKSGSTCFLF
jgi:hypothetical protein